MVVLAGALEELSEDVEGDDGLDSLEDDELESDAEDVVLLDSPDTEELDFDEPRLSVL